MTRQDVTRKLGWIVVLAAALAAPTADAARVTQVRIGDHARYTRIVLELDAPASYGLKKKEVNGGAELIVDLDASTVGRVVTSRSLLVESVALRPGPQGAIARVQLRRPDVQVREMVLKSPHRIVLDVSPAPVAASASAGKSAGSSASASVARSTGSSASTPGAPAARASAVESLPSAAPRAAAPPAEPEPPAVAAQPGDAKATPDLETTRDDASQAALAAEPRKPTLAAEPRRAPAAVDTAESGPGEAVLAPREHRLERAHPERMAAASGEAEAEAAQTPSRKKETSPPSSAASGSASFGLMLALVGLALLLLALLALRRRSARIARDAAAAPWPPPGAEERPEFRASVTPAAEEAEATQVSGVPEAAGPLFAEAEIEAERASRPDEEPDAPAVRVESPPAPPVQAEVPLPAEPEVVAKEESSLVIDELERRIERLEARLSDSLDARERLERQLAAHTEELRVQRAAIARTQRAVRAAVRGPEAAAGEATTPSEVTAPAPGSPGGER